jgi:drug/metabolite transporter (DMT)-like permease
MIILHAGELAALVTALCWAITAAAFESAGKRIGSLPVNFIRLIIAFFLIGIYTLFTRGMFLPLDASGSNWLWLFISGLIGFVIGDMFLFEAYVEIGSRISLLIMSSSPPITALAGFLILGEKLTLVHTLAIFVTMGGIALVILVKGDKDNKVQFSHPLKGILFALIGSLGQAFGLIFSKIGMGDLNPFEATQIRIIAAVLGFIIVISFKKEWRKVFASFKDRKAISWTGIGAFFGPFIGVSFSLLAIKYISTGIVSTITSISPILIIPISIIFLKEKVTLKEIIGALISIIGVALLFI